MATHLRHIGAAAALLVLAACATTATPPPDSGPPKSAAVPATCLTQAGTRLPAGDPNCSTLRRSISSQEISTTGAVTGTQALQLLDPSIAVGH